MRNGEYLHSLEISRIFQKTIGNKYLNFLKNAFPWPSSAPEESLISHESNSILKWLFDYP